MLKNYLPYLFEIHSWYVFDKIYLRDSLGNILGLVDSSSNMVIIMYMDKI
jgi:hypothetical protein